MRISRFLASAIAFHLLGCSSSTTVKTFDVRPGVESGSISDSSESGRTAASVDTIESEDLLGGDLYSAATLSDEAIQSITKQTVSAFDKSHKLANAQNSYSKRLLTITKDIKNEGATRLQFKVILNSDPSIVSFPNGAIRLSSGLMDLLEDEEILAVIGHEIGHIQAGHRHEKLQLAFANSAATKSISGGNGITGAGAAETKAYVESQIKSQFSQAEERQADAFSLDFLAQHQVTPKTALTVIEKLASLENTLTLLSNHPTAEDRIATLSKKLGEAVSEEKHVAGAKLKKQEQKVEKTQVVKAGIAQEENTAVDEIKALEIAEADLISPSEFSRAMLEKPVTTAQPAPAPRSGAEKVASGWYVQIAAETSHEAAAGKIGKLRESGDTAQIQKAVVNDTTYFRVLVGPYGNSEDANKRISELGANPLSVGAPFLKRVR